MDELTIGDKIYISSKQAAKITGYAKDYVGQLCREGRVEARLVGRNWYVLESSIREHRFGATTAPEIEISVPEEPEMSPVGSWEAPIYEAVKEESILPPLESSRRAPVTPDTSEAIALMQDAWKEWFATREQAQTPARAAEHEEPSIETESIEEEAETPVRVSDIPSNEAIIFEEEPEEEERHVPVTRVEEREEIEAYEPVITPVRTPVSTRTYIDLRAASGIVDLSQRREEVMHEPARPTVRSSRRRAKSGSNLKAQALLISIAGLAVAIAVIGSGLLDTTLATSGVGEGLRGTVIDAIRGESSVKK